MTGSPKLNYHSKIASYTASLLIPLLAKFFIKPPLPIHYSLPLLASNLFPCVTITVQALRLEWYERQSSCFIGTLNFDVSCAYVPMFLVRMSPPSLFCACIVHVTLLILFGVCFYLFWLIKKVWLLYLVEIHSLPYLIGVTC